MKKIILGILLLTAACGYGQSKYTADSIAARKAMILKDRRITEFQNDTPLVSANKIPTSKAVKDAIAGAVIGGGGGGATDTALIKNLIHDSLPTTNFYGKIYDSATWNNLISFTNNGGTFSVSGNKILGSGGDGGFLQSLDLNYYTGLKRFTTGTEVKVTAGAGGFGVGPRSSGSFIASNAIGRFNTANGRVYLNLGLNYSTNDSSAALSFSTNDKILLTLEMDVDRITVSAKNTTTNSNPVSLSYNYKFDLSSPITTPNTGKFAIYSIGGNFEVQRFFVYSKETKDALLCIAGDSKLSAYSSGYYSRSIPAILAQYYKSTVNLSGGGNLSIDNLNMVPEMIALGAKQVILGAGRNDSTAGVSAATTYANIDSTAARLTRAGIKVFHTLPFYETVAGQGPLMNHITTTFAADRIFPTYTPTMQPNSLNPDGIHPNEEGNRLHAEAIIGANILEGANNVTAFRDGSGITNHGNSQDFGSLKPLTTDAHIITNDRYGKYTFYNGGRWGLDTSSGRNNTYIFSPNTNTGIQSIFAGPGAGNNQSGNYATGYGPYALSGNTGHNAAGDGFHALDGNTADDAVGKGYFALLNNTGLGAIGFGKLAGANNTYDYCHFFGGNSSATANKQIVYRLGNYHWRLSGALQTADQLDSIPNASGILALRAKDSITVPVNMISQGTDGLFYKSIAPTSGTYTPTLTNVANISASTVYSFQYTRVGNVVTVSGEVDIDPTTTATLTQLRISLPIASALTASNELSGTSADDLGTTMRVAGDATNDAADLRGTVVDVTNRRFSVHFTYRIL